MPTYHYQAKDQDGEIVEGSQSAADKFVLYRQVKKQGLRVIHAEEVTASRNPLVRLNEKIKQLTFIKQQDIINFARNLGLMLEAGLSLSRTLSVLRRQASNSRFRRIIQEIESDISSGRQLYEALEKHPKVFSRLFVSMVKAGEESGTLAQSLATISDQMAEAHELTKKVRGALIYPAVIVLVMIAVAVMAMVYIVPTLTDTFEGVGVDLPLATRILIVISDFLINHAVWNIIGLLFFIGGLVWFFRTEAGRRVTDFTLLHLPVISNIDKEINSARTARTLASLLSSGVDYVVALEITQDVVQNSYYKSVLAEAREKVEHGDPLSGVFQEYQSLYPVFMSEMASVGEETGQLSEMFTNTAEYYEGEVAQKTKNISTIIEPVLMIIMGIGVGLFAYSMLMPMYSLVDVI